uniref:Sugar phosphate isomerase/epimerase n=1 Tax=Roseihalotalea indica TaxID=2867963 RepID=A0AA49JKN8_9BACT|nr:sugar phosphate isomerase/epimerase [Tunicatimonas sp. TK19036]
MVNPLLAQSKADKIGMVSYTYRNSFAKDVAKTLDTLQQMGITDMEFSNLFGTTAEELRAMLDERDMYCSSYGVGYDALVNETAEVARQAKVLGAKYVRVAWIPHEDDFTEDDLKKAVADFNQAGKELKEEHDLTFCYHNHGYEFQPYEKGTMYDYLMKQTNPDYVSFEIDVLWVVHPGADPVKLLKKYGDRYKLMHVKDLKKGVKGDFSGGTPKENDVTLGTGQMDFPAIMKAAKKAGVQHYYIEDESPTYYVQVPKSIAYLESLGLEK